MNANTPYGYRTQQIMDAANKAECARCEATLPVSELGEDGICQACAEESE